jgi:hypothetical protein
MFYGPLEFGVKSKVKPMKTIQQKIIVLTFGLSLVSASSAFAIEGL